MCARGQERILGRRPWLPVFALVIGLAASAAEPAPNSETLKIIQEMKARLDALEKQNQELRQTLDKAGIGPDGDRDADSGAVQKIVDDYLKTKEEKKQKTEDEAKQKKVEDGYTVGADLNLKAKWDYGLHLETEDKAFKVHVGGRTQYDTVFYSAPRNVQQGVNGTGPINDAMAFRRARFEISGTMWEIINFDFEYDFLNTDNVLQAGTQLLPDQTVPAGTRVSENVLTQDTPVPTDLWVEATQLPILENVRIGNMKPPISFEHMTSSRFLNFMERSYAFDAFIGGLDNGFRPGIMTYQHHLDQRLWTGVGVFKNNNSIFGFNVGDGEYDVTGRIVALPVYSEEGRCLVHVGVAASHRDPDQEFLRFRARTQLRNGPAALHTPMNDIVLTGATQDLVVPEFAFVWGPWSGNAEYFGTWVTDARPVDRVTLAPIGPPRGTAYYQAAYADLLYMLTGEARGYDLKLMRFSRIIPNENFFLVRGGQGNLLGRGAWQVGARYSWVDLNQLGIGNTRGDSHAITLGLNWFLNPNMKLQANYTIERRNVEIGNSSGTIHGYGMRMAADF